MFKKSTFPGFSCYQQWTSALYRSFFCFCFSCAFDKAAAFIFHIHPNNNLGNVRAKSSYPWPNLPRRTFNRYISAKTPPEKATDCMLLPFSFLRKTSEVVLFWNIQITSARGGPVEETLRAIHLPIRVMLSALWMWLDTPWGKKRSWPMCFLSLDYKRFWTVELLCMVENCCLELTWTNFKINPIGWSRRK